MNTSPTSNGKRSVLNIQSSSSSGNGEMVCVSGVSSRTRKIASTLLGDIADDSDTR